MIKRSGLAALVNACMFPAEDVQVRSIEETRIRIVLYYNLFFAGARVPSAQQGGRSHRYASRADSAGRLASSCQVRSETALPASCSPLLLFFADPLFSHSSVLKHTGEATTVLSALASLHALLSNPPVDVAAAVREALIPRMVTLAMAESPLKVETVAGWILKDLASQDALRSVLLDVGAEVGCGADKDSQRSAYTDSCSYAARHDHVSVGGSIAQPGKGSFQNESGRPCAERYHLLHRPGRRPKKRCCVHWPT